MILFNHNVTSNSTTKTPDAPRSLGTTGGGTNFRPALQAVEDALKSDRVAACEIKVRYLIIKYLSFACATYFRVKFM